MKPDNSTRRRGAGAAVLLALALPAVAMAAGERPSAAGNGDAAKGNRIEVTGNTARNVEVRCGPDGTRPTVNVNSVNVEAGALRGKTVIVTGRNTQDVRVQHCPKAPPGQLDGVNVNSVNIR